ncbi:twin arginine-targeting protein translocase TatB [Helicobacter sp. 11S02629-2]|nr:twin arginine-targeting protein translocase TatB [Helicobacter sp. 11S02629-2]
MFGFGFGEILLIVVVAIIFLGPDKLPKAIVDIAKFIKAVKKTIDGAKDTIDKELNISELKKEALEYKEKFEQQVQSIEKKTVNPIMQEYGNIDTMFADYNPKKILNEQVEDIKESASGLDSKKSKDEASLDELEDLATSNTRTVSKVKSASKEVDRAIDKSGLNESLVLNQLNNDLSVGEVNNIHTDIAAAQAGTLQVGNTKALKPEKKVAVKKEPISKEEREKRRQAKLEEDARKLELRAKQAKFKTNDIELEGKQARRQKKLQKKIEKSAK